MKLPFLFLLFATTTSWCEGKLAVRKYLDRHTADRVRTTTSNVLAQTAKRFRQTTKQHHVAISQRRRTGVVPLDKCLEHLVSLLSPTSKTTAASASRSPLFLLLQLLPLIGTSLRQQWHSLDGTVALVYSLVLYGSFVPVSFVQNAIATAIGLHGSQDSGVVVPAAPHPNGASSSSLTLLLVLSHLQLAARVALSAVGVEATSLVLWDVVAGSKSHRNAQDQQRRLDLLASVPSTYKACAYLLVLFHRLSCGATHLLEHHAAGSPTSDTKNNTNSATLQTLVRSVLYIGCAVSLLLVPTWNLSLTPALILGVVGTALFLALAQHPFFAVSTTRPSLEFLPQDPDSLWKDPQSQGRTTTTTTTTATLSSRSVPFVEASRWPGLAMVRTIIIDNNNKNDLSTLLSLFGESSEEIEASDDESLHVECPTEEPPSVVDNVVIIDECDYDGVHFSHEEEVDITALQDVTEEEITFVEEEDARCEAHSTLDEHSLEAAAQDMTESVEQDDDIEIDNEPLDCSDTNESELSNSLVEQPSSALQSKKLPPFQFVEEASLNVDVSRRNIQPHKIKLFHVIQGANAIRAH